MIKQWTKSYVCPDAANETLEILVSGSYLVQKQHLVNSSKTLSLPPPARRRALGEKRVQRVGHVHLVLRRLDLLHRRHDGRQRCRCRLLQARQVVKIKGRRLLIIVFIFDILFRKGGLLLNNILVVIGAVLMGTAKAAGSYHMLILGRCNVTLTSPIVTITTLTIIVTN